MALSEGDKAICMEIAREIIEKTIEKHIECCPVKQRLLISKAKLVGIIIGVGVCSGLGSGSVIMLILDIFK